VTFRREPGSDRGSSGVGLETQILGVAHRIGAPARETRVARVERVREDLWHQEEHGRVGLERLRQFNEQLRPAIERRLLMDLEE